MMCSALSGAGVADVWATIERYRDVHAESGAIAARRGEQARAWMWSAVNQTLMARIRQHARTRDRVAALEAKVSAGEVTPAEAAREILSTVLKD